MPTLPAPFYLRRCPISRQAILQPTRANVANPSFLRTAGRFDYTRQTWRQNSPPRRCTVTSFENWAPLGIIWRRSMSLSINPNASSRIAATGGKRIVAS